MRILLGLSGGVDSAYAAKKLMQDGHCVEGAVLLMHEHTEIDAAALAAQELSIKLHVIDATDEFNRIVKENFVSEYLSARTPNPCIICNERVKFKFLYDFAMKEGFDAIATGHYAKVTKICDQFGQRYAISQAEDTKKDQSYMLYRLPQKILSTLVLPLGDTTKLDVRKEAKSRSLSAADRRDSQEICFLPDGNYAEYIESVRGPSKKGDFIDEKGNILGTHNGIIRYTVGQRKGLGISLGSRVFVTEINPDDNTVTLSGEPKGKSEIFISDPVFSGVTPKMLSNPIKARVKIRYSAPLVEAECRLLSDGRISLKFDAPLRAAPGQSAVAYIDKSVAFGGIIC